MARGWSIAQVAEALEGDSHTIGDWVASFRQAGPEGLTFEQTGGPPRLALDGEQQAKLKAAVQASPQGAGIDLANWPLPNRY